MRSVGTKSGHRSPWGETGAGDGAADPLPIEDRGICSGIDVYPLQWLKGLLTPEATAHSKADTTVRLIGQLSGRLCCGGEAESCGKEQRK